MRRNLVIGPTMVLVALFSLGTLLAIGEPLSPEQSAAFVITSTADSGSGTLRQALLNAHSGDVITFDPVVFPSSVPATVSLASALPDIDSAAFTNGLNVHSDGNTIRGLQIANFPDVGISLGSGARDNILEGNLVYSNGSRGIGLWGASFNTIRGNIIGTNASGTATLGNGGSGIFVTQGGSDNHIGPDNVSAYNDVDGIEVYGPDTLRNVITRNSVYDNDHMGIELWSGGNKELMTPVVFDFDLNTGHIAGTACCSCTVEIFSDIDNEGRHYEGRTVTSRLGAFVFDKEVPFTGPRLTATATDVDGNTSQFSLPTTGTHKSAIIQVENPLPRFRTQTKNSEDLLDNRLVFRIIPMQYVYLPIALKYNAR